MDELEVIKRLGCATSPEIQRLVNKSLQNTISQLKSFEKLGEIKVIEIQENKSIKRLYVYNELYELIEENL